MPPGSGDVNGGRKESIKVLVAELGGMESDHARRQAAPLDVERLVDDLIVGDVPVQLQGGLCGPVSCGGWFGWSSIGPLVRDGNQ